MKICYIFGEERNFKFIFGQFQNLNPDFLILQVQNFRKGTIEIA